LLDVVTAPAPRPDAVVESGQRYILGLTACQKPPEALKSGELEIARPRADAAEAVVLDEVDSPRIAVTILKLEQLPSRQ
jgi:hypothetical protein